MECSQQKSFSFSLFRFHRFIVLQAKLTGTAASACASFFNGQKRDDFMTTEKGGDKDSKLSIQYHQCTFQGVQYSSARRLFSLYHVSVAASSFSLPSSLKRVTFCYTKVPKHVLLGNWDGKSLQIRFRLHQQPICMNALFVC